MSPGAITIDHEATTSAKNADFIGIEVGGDWSCSVVIGSRLAAIAQADAVQWGRTRTDRARTSRTCGHLTRFGAVTWKNSCNRMLRGLLASHGSQRLSTARPFVSAYFTSWAECLSHTFKSPEGRPIGSTWRTLVVARRPSRQYLQAASKWTLANWIAIPGG